MPSLWFLPAPLSFALLREPVCPLPRTIPIPVPVPLRVPARREVATGCQAGAGLPSHRTGLRGRRLLPVAPAIPAGLGSTPRKTANEGQGLLPATPLSAPLSRERVASPPFPT